MAYACGKGMLDQITTPSWQRLLSVEQAQIQRAVDEYESFIAVAPAETLNDATEKLLRFLRLCLQRKGAFLQDLRWHSGEAKLQMCVALSEMHERQVHMLEQAQRLFSTLPYSTEELVSRVRDLVRKVAERPD